MKTEVEIRERIHRLRMIRAGSIFNRQFEGGELFMLLWVLGEEPTYLRNKEEIECWIRTAVSSAEYSTKYLSALESKEAK